MRRHLDADPACIHTRVSESFFPKQNARSGGSVYIWTLGADKTAHAIAREFGHPDILAELVERSPATLRLMVAARAGDEAAVQQLIADDSALISKLTEEDRRALPDAARDDDLEAVRVMLAAGWPVDAWSASCDVSALGRLERRSGTSARVTSPWRPSRRQG